MRKSRLRLTAYWACKAQLKVVAPGVLTLEQRYVLPLQLAVQRLLPSILDQTTEIALSSGIHPVCPALITFS